MKPNELIKYRALSRYLSKGDTNIRSNNVPKKYKRKVDVLLFFIDMWVKLVENETI